MKVIRNIAQHDDPHRLIFSEASIPSPPPANMHQLVGMRCSVPPRRIGFGSGCGGALPDCAQDRKQRPARRDPRHARQPHGQRGRFALRCATLPIAWALSVPRLLRRSVARAWARAHRSVRQVNFMQLLVDYEMLAFVQKHLVPGFAEDDIVLEVTAT